MKPLPLKSLEGVGASRVTDLPEEIARLNDRERVVLAAYYYDGHLEAEIAVDLKVSARRVGQIRAAALKKIGPYAARLSEGQRPTLVRPIQIGFMNNI